MIDERTVVEWVGQPDPALRWQVERDVLGSPQAVWAPIRALVETEGVGAQLLSMRDADGRWSGGLDGTAPDPRLADAIELVRSKRDQAGRWSMEWAPRGVTPFDLDDGPGQPSRWITLRALRVLAWWEDPT